MNMRLIGGVTVVLVLIPAIYGVRLWRDINPRYETTSYTLKSCSMKVPAAWPKPDDESGFVDIKNSPDGRPGSIDQFRQGISIHDYGVNAKADKVIEELRSGYESATSVSSVVLANGVVAQTWTFWEPMGELNQEHRAYVFIASNGRVYSVMEPMARDWRTKRRYGNLFRAVLGSMKFER